MENVFKSFAAIIVEMQKKGEPEGSALLATTLSSRDIAAARLIMRRCSTNEDETARALATAPIASVLCSWIQKKGEYDAARITLLVARISAP